MASKIGSKFGQAAKPAATNLSGSNKSNSSSGTGFYTAQELQNYNRSAPSGSQFSHFEFPAGHPQAGQQIPPGFGSVEGAVPIWGPSIGQQALANLPSVPSLQHFTGNTAVGIPDNLGAALAQITQFSNSPGFQALLSGQPNIGLLDQAVFNPMNQALEHNTLPATEELFSQSPLGAGAHSGAVKQAQVGAITNNANQQAALRYQAVLDAQNKQLQAASLLPQFAQTQAITLENEIQNMSREISTHFQNQGLSISEYQLELGATSAALQAAGLELQAEQLQFEMAAYEEALELQKRALEEAQSSSLFGSIGSIAGSLIGNSIVPGLGAVVGGSIGGGLGQTIGGNPIGGFSTITGGLGQATMMNYLSSLQKPSLVSGGGPLTFNTAQHYGGPLPLQPQSQYYGPGFGP